MITYEQFQTIVIEDLKRDIGSNIEQNNSIKAEINDSGFIVAGPGSGKTTVMVLKVLKYIFVDDIKPEEILVTTFTKKAAEELLSRILSWGQEIKNNIVGKMFITDDEELRELMKIDLNKILTGTLDSISEELMRLHRDPGTNQPIIIEDFISKNAMTKIALFKGDKYQSKDLQEYLGHIDNRDTSLSNLSRMCEVLLKFKDRLYYDHVNNWESLNDGTRGARLAIECIEDYVNELNSRNMLDFAMLEFRFLESLNNGKFDEYLSNIRVVLVDEYQDTNLLQEKIYFKIAESALKNGGNITVVGDDDQSLYRFRGATVDLFTDFKARAKESLGIDVTEVNLKNNYRSSEHIVDLCNHFVGLDSDYQDARVSGKPDIEFAKDNTGEDKINVPVLGMFRQNPKILSRDLSKLINKLVKGEEVNLNVKRVLNSKSASKYSSNDKDMVLNARKMDIDLAKDKGSIKLQLDPKDGSPSDIALLSYSPKERIGGNNMFPHHLKKDLNSFKESISVFNPRGQDLESIEDVSIFCGLMLECIDPDAFIQKRNKAIPKAAKFKMNRWRKKAIKFMETSPDPQEPITLYDFMTHWRTRIPYNTDRWPSSVGLLDLAYKLVRWLPNFKDDIEGFVYFETITKTISQSSFFNEFNGRIFFDSESLTERSVNEVLWNVFIPIATGGVSVDESYLNNLPHDSINIMSIHQSKGLEFPFVIVDVGSRFNKNAAKTSSLRFPKKEPKSTILEDRIRSHSNLGISERNVSDRNFDDLTRLYFVAFSRAEDVLLLIGLDSNIDGYDGKSEHKNIPNVALGWNRNEEYIGFNEIYLI